MESNRIAVACVFTPGAFSSERIFEIRTAGGGRHQGVADVRYCWDPAGGPLPSPLEGSHTGRVAARLLGKTEAEATIVVPGNDTLNVDIGELRERP